VTEGETGWLHDAEDLAGFAARIAKAAGDPAALDRMRAAARRQAEARFDRRAMLAGYEAALAELLPPSRHPGAARHG
jgi:glycosyltransferase involved in cell wall biosynthesis